MNKLLILDKSAFHGTACDKLIGFVRCHHVVLPYPLCVECAISQKGDTGKDSKDAKRLMQKLLAVVKNGAYAGKAPARIVEEERLINAPIDSLIDVEETRIMRESQIDDKPDLEKISEECDKAFQSIVGFVKQWADQYYQEICRKGLEKEFRAEIDEGDVVGRLGKWLQVVDKMKKDILDQFLSDGSNDVSSDRWEWQMLRLSIAWGIELASKRNKSGPGFENRDISNDVFDIEYVSHLSQADGLITCDNNLVKPLALAAFPNKEVFGSIDDIP